MSPATLNRLRDRQTERVSSIALHFSSDRMETDPSTGVPKLITGQAVTFARAVAGASVTGSDGNAIAAIPRDIPVWSFYTIDGEERPALRLSSDDTFQAALSAARHTPQALALYMEFRAGTDAPFCSIGAQTAPHLTLSSPSTRQYRITHDNNVDSAVSVTTSVAASEGDLVKLFAVLNANGSVTLWTRYNSDDWVEVGTSSAPAAGLAAAWSGATWDLGTDGADDFFSGKIDLGPVNDETTIGSVF